MSYGAAIAAGAAVLGSAMSANSQGKANEANAGLAREQMEFQALMSNTAHQREMRDMRLAGLNPILSAGGSGASTPGGASATMIAPDIGSSAKAATDAYNQISRLDADTKNTMADTQLKATQQVLSQEQAASTAKDVESKKIGIATQAQEAAARLRKTGADSESVENANKLSRSTFRDAVAQSANKTSMSNYENSIKRDDAKYSHVADKFYDSMNITPSSSAKKIGPKTNASIMSDFFSDLTGIGLRRLGGTK